ncbi:MAG: glycoside hydrolase domain-containing protein [Thermoguttaceae bacterium]
MRLHITLTTVFAALVLLAPAPGAAAPRNIPAGMVAATLVRMAPNLRTWTSDATLWRYYETWQTDVARLDSGQLIRVDPLNPRIGFSGAKIWSQQQSGRNPQELRFPVREATKVNGSPFPPPDWKTPDFHDGDWVRTATPMANHYRSLAAVFLRAKFAVKEPAQVQELTLDASFQGGAVFYLNGQEIGRAFLPQGKLDGETLAEDYDKEVFVSPSGSLLHQVDGSMMLMGEEDLSRGLPDPLLQARYKKRFRHASIKIPPGVLTNGVNVLAVEVRRAAAHEVMFTHVDPKEMGYNVQEHRAFWWNRASLENLTLTAKAPLGAVVGNISRPKGVQVWNWPAWEPVDPRSYRDPNEPLGPIRLCGARNGTVAGQVVVSSTAAIRGLEVAAAELKGPAGAVIPCLCVQVRYPVFHARSDLGFAALEESAPAPVLPHILTVNYLGFAALKEPTPAEVSLLRQNPAGAIAMQPVWLTVEVPRDAPAGDYTGTLSVRAEDLPPVAVPIELHVSGWTLPDSQDYVAHMGYIQSPDSVAIRYGVPMWSEPHWKLIERSLAVLRRIATKELTIPLIRRTQFGNEHAMLWWIRQEDGSLVPNFQIIERYVKLAAKHLGKIPVVIFYVSEGEDDRTIPWITEFDPQTGEWIAARGPRWGTAEARAFWKPACDGLHRILAQNGLEQSFAWGYHADGGNGPECAKECIADLKLLVSEGRWVRLGHGWFSSQRLDRAPNGNPYARVALVGNYAVLWDPEKDKPFYGWQNPYVVTAYPRDQNIGANLLRHYRFCAELILLTGQRDPPAGWGLSDFAGEFGRETFLGMRGFGPFGGDFWPVLGGHHGWHDIIARYNDPGAGHWDPRSSWSTVQLNAFQNSFIVGDGADGPVSSVQVEVLREGLQEADARVFVQNTLLDKKLAARLGPDLARRCKLLCDRRTWELRYLCEYTVMGYSKSAAPSHYILDSSVWRQRSRELYDMAAEVAEALGNHPAGKEQQR